MEKLNPIDQLAVRYSSNPIISGLLSLVQGWALPDTLLRFRAEEIRKERLETFFDELSKGKISLTESKIKSEDFLHCYFLTVRAVTWTRQRQKIRFFARLLKSWVRDSISEDEYEEYLKILDELTFNELTMLIVLEKYDIQTDDANEKREELLRELGVTPADFNAKLSRLTRTGCFSLATGLPSYKDVLTEGHLTTTFYKLKRWALDKEKEITAEQRDTGGAPGHI